MHDVKLTLISFIYRELVFVLGIYFSDNLPFNPCGTLLDVYFYAHPVDPHLYYQCDESGTAYERSCDNLVWDDVAKACNWASSNVKTTLPTEISTFSLSTFSLFQHIQIKYSFSN